MDDEHLSLTWNNHGATYKQMLNLLRIENILTDCTLACDGYKFSVHRLVLVTCSNFFKTLLGDVNCQYPIVYLRGVGGKEMKALIDFMYLGKIDVPQKEVPDLLSTAETLQIKGLGVTEEGREEKGVSCKRKRSSDSFANGGRSPYTSISSPLPSSFDSCENVSSDRHSSSTKVRRRETLPPSGYDELFSSVSGSRTSHMKGDSFYPPERNKAKDILGSSVLKSSPVCSSDVQTSVSEGTSITSTISASPKSIQLSHFETSNPLRSLPDSSMNIFSSNTGVNSETKFSGASAVSREQLSTQGQDFETLAEVKEEAIDYTRSSSFQTSENSLVSHFEGGASAVSESVHHNFQSDDASQFLDTLAKDPSTMPRPYRQDENTENGRELGRPYSCPICCKSFAKIAILKRHHLAHFRPYNCHLCSRSFTRREVLAEHVLEHNGADLRLPCPVCKMTIKRKRNLQAHIKVKHPEYHMRKAANNEALC